MTIHQLFTDSITAQGAVRRIRFCFLAINDRGVRTWHYYGVTPAQRPPTSADPVTQHAEIMLPADMVRLPTGEGDDALYNIGLTLARLDVLP